jgi:ATPase subunit of ABC transporter with duplicated ATPase domains
MITVKNIGLNFGARKLFQEVNIKFTEGNCYGIIGANGAGKSTFLKILSGEQEASVGEVEISKGQTIAVFEARSFSISRRKRHSNRDYGT